MKLTHSTPVSACVLTLALITASSAYAAGPTLRLSCKAQGADAHLNYTQLLQVDFEVEVDQIPNSASGNGGCVPQEVHSAVTQDSSRYFTMQVEALNCGNDKPGVKPYFAVDFAIGATDLSTTGQWGQAKWGGIRFEQGAGKPIRTPRGTFQTIYLNCTAAAD